LLLRQGKSIALDNEESLSWIKKASENGLIEASSVAGRIYFHGDPLQSRAPVEARSFIKAAAEGGDPVCQNIYGIILRDGVGGATQNKDTEKAVQWFQKSADQNNAKAQSNLALLIGLMPRDLNRIEAMKWLLLAKEQRETTAERVYNEHAYLYTPEEIQSAKTAASDWKLKAK